MQCKSWFSYVVISFNSHVEIVVNVLLCANQPYEIKNTTNCNVLRLLNYGRMSENFVPNDTVTQDSRMGFQEHAPPVLANGAGTTSSSLQTP